VVFVPLQGKRLRRCDALDGEPRLVGVSIPEDILFRDLDQDALTELKAAALELADFYRHVVEEAEASVS